MKKTLGQFAYENFWTYTQSSMLTPWKYAPEDFKEKWEKFAQEMKMEILHRDKYK